MNGPGMFVWQAAKCCGGSPREFVSLAQRQGWNWIAPKVINESGAVRTADMEFIRAAQGRLQDAGVSIVPWCYLRPPNVSAMAKLCADVCVELAATEFIVNAEIEFKRYSDKEDRAKEFCEAFKRHAPKCRLHLSTFAQPSLHGDFPYRAFLERCDGFMPQCYGNSPEKQLHEAAAVASQYGVALIPTFRAYCGDGRDSKPGILQEAPQMAEKAKNLGCPAWNWWHWQSVEGWPEMLEALQFSTGDLLTCPGCAQLRTELRSLTDKVRNQMQILEGILAAGEKK